jgi:DNA-binding NtrC family response regulator
LVVDDDPKNLELLAVKLTQEGYRVITAQSGKDALEAIKLEKPDLVLLDIRMPEIDGMEFMRQIKKLDDDIEVIVLTGSTSIENAVKALRYDGAFDFLTKPLENVDQLINSVREALQKHRLQKKSAFQDAKTGQ